MPSESSPQGGPASVLRSPYLFLALAMLMWAGNALLGRAMHAQITPVGLAFWRWLTAFVVLLPFAGVVLWRQRRVVGQEWKLLGALGVLGGVCFTTLLYKALSLTTATNVTLIYANVPIVVALFSALLFGERLSPRQGLGIALSMVGVTTIITGADFGVLLRLGFNPGDLWAVGTVPVWSLYTVLLRRRRAGLPPQAFQAVIAGTAAALLLPAWLWEAAEGTTMALTPATAGTVLYTALFASIGSYMLWNTAVPQVGPNKAGLFTHLYPVFTTALAVLFLGERLYPYHGVGVALIALGLWLTTSARARPARAR